MNDRVTLRPPQLPAPDLERTPAADAAAGVRPLSRIEPRMEPQMEPRIEPRNEVPTLGPFRMGSSIYYDLQVYPGPLLRVVSGPSSGVALDAKA